MPLKELSPMTSSGARACAAIAALAAMTALVPAPRHAAAAEDTEDHDLLMRADLSRGDPAGVTWDLALESTSPSGRSLAKYHVATRGYDSLVEFVEPVKTRGNKLLIIERNMWLVKPGLRKPVPISSRQRLLGQAANGDLASTNYAGDYVVESAGERTVSGVPCRRFVLRAASKRVTYERIRYWVSRRDRVGVAAEYYTVSGRLMKLASFEHANRLEARGIARPFISKMTIRDAGDDSSQTVLTFSHVRAENVSDATFNLNLVGP
jgi:hypothetical protein